CSPARDRPGTGRGPPRGPGWWLRVPSRRTADRRRLLLAGGPALPAGALQHLLVLLLAHALAALLDQRTHPAVCSRVLSCARVLVRAAAHPSECAAVRPHAGQLSGKCLAAPRTHGWPGRVAWRRARSRPPILRTPWEPDSLLRGRGGVMTAWTRLKDFSDHDALISREVNAAGGTLVRAAGEGHSTFSVVPATRGADDADRGWLRARQRADDVLRDSRDGRPVADLARCLHDRRADGRPCP